MAGPLEKSSPYRGTHQGIRNRSGFTLAELLITITILTFLTAAFGSAFHVFLNAHRYANAQSTLQRDSTFAMERMTQAVRKSTLIMTPNAGNTDTSVLALSGLLNDDNDYYFGDPLFPRIDEDPGADLTNDSHTGVENVDDDGDGSTDEGGNVEDDDEDGMVNEEILDGLDNDNDDRIDEDLGDDRRGNGAPGILGFDDDGDGLIDEGGDNGDDDEDGSSGEDPLNSIVYKVVGTDLVEVGPNDAVERTIAENVSGFSLVFEPVVPNTSESRIKISLELTDEDGSTFTLEETVFPRNTLQRLGKRVR